MAASNSLVNVQTEVQYLPGIKAVAALSLDRPTQLFQLGYHPLDDGCSQNVAVVEKSVKGSFEAFLVELPAEVLVSFDVVIRVRLVNLRKKSID